MAVDLSVFGKLKTKEDFDQAAQEFAMKKQLGDAQLMTAQAQIAKANEFDPDKVGALAFVKAAQGLPLTPQERAAAQYVDAKSGGIQFDPVTGNQIQKPRLSDKIGLDGLPAGGNAGGNGGNAPMPLPVPAPSMGGNGGGMPAPGQIPAISAGDLPPLPAKGGAPAVDAREGAPASNGTVDNLDTQMQAELAAAGQNPRLQQEIRVKYAGAKAEAIKTAGKPLPSAVNTMQQGLLGDLGLTGGITADLGAVNDTLKNGNLELGPVENLKSRFKNWAGYSDPNSQNYASTKSMLEKMRNDSLRLNKGVQTEGDATRAWNELFENMNDATIVQNKLNDIQGYNQRAAALKQMQLDQMRQDYNKDPIDGSKYSNQDPVVLQRPGAALPPAKNPANLPKLSPSQIPMAAVKELKADASPQARAEFDATFGTGASNLVLGKQK